MVADVRFQGVGHSGIPSEVRTAVLFRLEGGKIRSMESHGTREDALEAVGLRE